MDIKLKRVNGKVHFEGSSKSTDVVVHIDGSPDIGGEALGARPMELVLMALGSCSALDLLSILKKKRQQVDDLQISVAAKRVDAVPSVFSAIHITFTLEGDLLIDKVQKAAELAVKKYCSVHDMLAAGGIDITYDVVLS